MRYVNKRNLEITATELKSNLGMYLDEVKTKKNVVITKNGKKIARLTPYLTDFDSYMTVRESEPDYVYGSQKISYEEFKAISSKTTQRIEFLNGEIIKMDSPNISHQKAIGYFYILFSGYLQDRPCEVFLAPFDVTLWKWDEKENQLFDTPDVFQPDLLIACDLDEEGVVTDRDRYMGTPALVVEILSPSTRSRDMVDKLNTYMLSGVKEYVLVDSKQEQILIYTFVEHEIDSFQAYKKGEMARSIIFQGLEIPVSDVFS